MKQKFLLCPKTPFENIRVYIQIEDKRSKTYIPWKLWCGPLLFTPRPPSLSLAAVRVPSNATMKYPHTHLTPTYNLKWPKLP